MFDYQSETALIVVVTIEPIIVEPYISKALLVVEVLKPAEAVEISIMGQSL
jgi:hypothetical protein